MCFLKLKLTHFSFLQFFVIVFIFLSFDTYSQTTIGASPYTVPSSGSYKIPVGVTAIEVYMWGGGGGSGGAGDGTLYGAGGGGGGGAFVKLSFTGLASEQSFSVGIGNRGAAGGNNADGGDGGNTTFTILGNTYTANGGKKGLKGNGASGAGGAAIPLNAIVVQSQKGGNGGAGSACSSALLTCGGGGGGAGGLNAAGNNAFVANTISYPTITAGSNCANWCIPQGGLGGGSSPYAGGNGATLVLADAKKDPGSANRNGVAATIRGGGAAGGNVNTATTRSGAQGGPGEIIIVYISACTVSSASSSPTLCVNTPMTSITHTTTGVTGITSSTGLPTGVTAAYASNAITISGTPSVSGTFNYTITPTGCATTATGTITVNPSLPASVNISRLPAGAICAGTSVTFTAVSTNGGTTPSYQWRVNGLPVGTNSTTFSSSTLVNSDVVTCVLTSNATPCLTGSPATSNSITMTVNPNLPASVNISRSPAGAICAGTSVTFTAAPTNGGTTPSYQWKVNGANVGTNSPTFTSAALTNGQVVTCVMTSNASPCLTGSPAKSNSITMTVNPNLPASVSIAASPAGAICAGTSVTFTATPTNGGASPSYQWKVNGTNVGTGATYTSTTLANNDVVTCVMTSNASPCLTGSPATSNAITMTVSSVAPSTSLTTGDFVWDGSSSTDYVTMSNWSTFDGTTMVPASSFPTNSTNVIIPEAQACVSNQPSLGVNTVYAKNFIVESGATINMGSGTLYVSGDFRNYGTFNEGTSTVIMNGSSDRDTIYGIGASLNFYNLTINKSGGIEAVLGSHIDVTNELRVVSKDLRLNSLNINLGTAGTLLDEGPGHRVYCDCATGYIQRIASIPAGVTVDPGNLGLTITTTSGKPMGLTTIKRRHMRAGSQTGVNELKPGKPGVYRIFDVSPEFNGGTTYPLASGGLDVDLEYQYYIDEVGSDIAPLEDQFMVWRSGDAGSTWQSFGGTTNTATKTITLTGWPQFSWLTGGPPPSALPIELVSFEANCKGTNQVSITWSTATEHNTSHFVLDKSRDGVTWDLLGQVQAAGNSSQLTNYEMIDSEQLSGVTYYRLKQVDMNGEVETFYPVSASCKGGAQGNVLTTHPNPSTEGFYVNLFTETMEGNGQLTILDASGRRVYEKAISIKNGNTIFHIGDFDV